MQTNRIDELMREQGRTNKWLAGELNVHYSTICSYCNNKTQPNLRKMALISQVLGVKMQDLVK